MSSIHQPQVILKNANQFVFTPKRHNYVRTDAYIGTWYPSARPYQHYRYRGTSSSLPTYLSASSKDKINLEGVTIEEVSTEWSISSSYPTEVVQIVNGTGTYASLPIVFSPPLSYSFDGNTYTLQNMIEQGNLIILTWSSDNIIMTWTSTSNTNFNPVTFEPCEYCKDSHYMVGTPFKLLGKNDHGRSKGLSNSKDGNGCFTCRPRRGPVGSRLGNISSFSGNPGIRSANTHISKNYYVSYSKYLHNRGKLYDTNNVIHRIPEIQYTKEGLPVWGNQVQEVETTDRFGNPLTLNLNSSYYYNNAPGPGCKLAVFNPSNKEFATQGSVDSSSRILRLKYNTIVKNNSSIKKTYNTNISYSPDPIFINPLSFNHPPRC